MSQRNKTSFIQYVTCKICKLHHNNGTKHLYSKQHQKNLKVVLKKCLSKIAEGKKSMKVPDVHDEAWEANRKFWCYFCDTEFPKHSVQNNLMISCLGMVYHFADHEHYEAVKRFLKVYRISDEGMKYIIKKSELVSFIESLPVARAKYLKEMEAIHQSHIAQIREVEKKRANTLQEAASESALAETVSTVGNHAGNSYQFGLFNHQEKKPISTQKDEVKIPPWLLPADAKSCVASTSSTSLDSSGTPPVIGPTIGSFLEHVRKQKKSSLNPKRVGVNFDHKSKTSASWLPSFGRVWNQGCRKKSKIQYWKQTKKQKDYT